MLAIVTVVVVAAAFARGKRTAGRALIVLGRLLLLRHHLSRIGNAVGIGIGIGIRISVWILIRVRRTGCISSLGLGRECHRRRWRYQSAAQSTGRWRRHSRTIGRAVSGHLLH